MRVLLTEDEQDIASVVKRALERDGHVVTAVRSLSESRDALSRGVDVLVLDLKLPDGSGLTLCREIRAAHSALPILILTASTELELRVQGLQAGANEYLNKPFALSELRTRVRALGRRALVVTSSVYVHEDLRLDVSGRRATRSDQQIPMTLREWAILEVLIGCSGTVVTKLELLEAVWGETGARVDNNVQLLVGRLRRKLGVDLIRTAGNQGYCFMGRALERLG